jgi:hypothetical protein
MLVGEDVIIINKAKELFIKYRTDKEVSLNIKKGLLNMSIGAGEAYANILKEIIKGGIV